MKLSREEFYDSVRALFIDISTNKKVVDQLAKILQPKGFTKSDIIKIIKGVVPIQVVSDVELGAILKAIYDVTKDNEYNLNKFFTEQEIKNINVYKKVKNKVENYLYFTNVVAINEKQFICPKVSYQNIKKWYENYLITYNTNTQRETTRKNVGGKIIETITLNPDSVSEIADKMLKGKFTPNLITFNIRNITGEENFIYNEKEQTLTIFPDEQTFVDIVDGMHRCAGIMKALQEHPELEGYMVVNILHYTEEEAQEFIWQEDQRNPINKEFIKLFNPDDVDMAIAKDINKYGNNTTNEMFNKIARDNEEVKYTDKYITFENLALSIKHNFKYDSARDIRKIKNKIIEGLNVILGYLKELGYNKNNSPYFTQSAIIGYISIIAQQEQINDAWLEQKIDNLLKINKEEVEKYEKAKYRKKDIEEISKFYQSL